MQVPGPSGSLATLLHALPPGVEDDLGHIPVAKFDSAGNSMNALYAPPINPN
jgi:hypothetical protein